MSQPTILKVYASLWPASPAILEGAQKICQSAMPAEGVSLSLDGNLFLVSFEGVWFPVDEILAMIEANLGRLQEGKLDVLDLEAWRLRRCLIQNGKIVEKEAPLNNILDYSGH